MEFSLHCVLGVSFLLTGEGCVGGWTPLHPLAPLPLPPPPPFPGQNKSWITPGTSVLHKGSESTD